MKRFSGMVMAYIMRGIPLANIQAFKKCGKEREESSPDYRCGDMIFPDTPAPTELSQPIGLSK
jgi:hypothetical protein